MIEIERAEFVELGENEYESFVSTHRLGNFLQSPAIGERRRTSGWRPYMVGVKNEQGEVVAVALMTSRLVLGKFSLFEIQQGPIMDYDNEPLVQFFFTQLRQYLRNEYAILLRMNPPLLLNHRDGEARVIDDGYDGNRYIRMLKQQGLFHISNKTVDANSELLRWYSTKDMGSCKTADDLLKSFDQKARWHVRKAQKIGVNVREIKVDEVDEFLEVLEHTGERRGFAIRDKQYYTELAKCFGDRVLFCIAQLDVNVYEANLKQQLKDASASNKNFDLDSCDKKMLKRVIAARETELQNLEKLANIDSLRENGDLITMAGAMFINYGNELVYLSSGSYEKYNEFEAPYAVQWYAMLYALEHHISRYNFYGTRGNFSGHPEQHGVYQFKKGLGGVVEEQIGYFEMYPYGFTANLNLRLAQYSYRQTRKIVGNLELGFLQKKD